MSARSLGLRTKRFPGWDRAGVAQLVEHLICNQRVGGSNPFASSTKRSRKVGPVTVHWKFEVGTEAQDFSRRDSGFCLSPGLSSPVIPLQVHTPSVRRFFRTEFDAPKRLQRQCGWVDNVSSFGLERARLQGLAKEFCSRGFVAIGAL